MRLPADHLGMIPHSMQSMELMQPCLLQVVWRFKQLGFNAVRLPFKFTDLEMQPLIIEHQCQVAPAVRPSTAAAAADSTAAADMVACRITNSS